MTETNITLNCIIKGVKFIGSFGDSFLNGEDLPNNTRLHSRYEVNVPFEEFHVESISLAQNNKVSLGDLFIVPPKTYYLFLAHKPRVKNFAFRLEFEVMQKTNESVSFYNEIISQLSLEGIKYFYLPWAYGLCSIIRAEFNKAEYLGKEFARAKFEEFILLLIREIINTKSNDKGGISKGSNEVSVRNEKIDSFFNTKYSIPNIAIYDLAKELNLSVRQVNRILKEEYNTSFHAKLVERRLMHGKKNLIRTDRTIEIIAEKIGFSSTSGFYVAFKKEFGMTPKEYRQKYKNV